MKKIALVFSLFAMAAFGADSWEGVISDAKCAKAHAGEKLNEKCVLSPDQRKYYRLEELWGRTSPVVHFAN